MDISNKNSTDADSQQFITSNDQHQMNANLTAIEYAPMVASLVQEKSELPENVKTTFNPINETLATRIPIFNKTRTEFGRDVNGGVGIHTTNVLQRNATDSQELNSRVIIKSSSTPSAMANNNTSTQKLHKPDAPMLNYIFDSHLANKHRHYDPRYV